LKHLTTPPPPPKKYRLNLNITNLPTVVHLIGYINPHYITGTSRPQNY
jgi:hypothetical protein